MADLPSPRDFSRPPSDYDTLNDVTKCGEYLFTTAVSKHKTVADIDRVVRIVPSLASFLDAESKHALSSVLIAHPGYTDIDDPYLFCLCPHKPLHRPHNPIPHRVRGPMKDSPKLSAAHDRPLPPLVFHFAWDFLSPRERVTLVQAVPSVMTPYAKLRRKAASQPIFELRQRRPPVDQLEPLCRRRAMLMACALIRFNFIYSDMIRWLGGEYTNDYRDWTSVWQIAEAVKNIPVEPSQPPIDFERAIHVSTSGAPIAGHFQCNFSDVARRERYDNHPSMSEVTDAVRKKFAKEESRSYQIAFPRFLWAFIYGLFISPITFVIRRAGEEGRICPDPSNAMHPGDTGAANAYMPKTGEPGKEDENPPVYYGTALDRFLILMWNLRIAGPRKDILQHVDDVSAAYHRQLYHPSAGIVFAQVFMEFLMIPCGLIFGGRSSPSWCMQSGEVRARLAAVGDFSSASSELAENIRIPPPLTLKEQSQLAQAAPDAIHKGDRHLQTPYIQSSFVDDNVTAAWAENIRKAINQSVLGAHVMFGFPEEDRRPPPLNDKKWEWLASFIVQYLGYIIDTRRMLLLWPLAKRQQLAKWLDDYWLNDAVKTFSPLEASRLLGLLRHSSPVCPLGIYLSLRIQYIINDYLSNHRFASWTKMQSWWIAHRFPLLSEIRTELRVLRRTLNENLHEPTWCRSIGLIIRREPNIIASSDASYEGIGGHLVEFNAMWRISAQDLVDLGWVLYGDEKELKQPLDERQFEGYSLEREGMHINLLEFVALIINVWCAVKFIKRWLGKGAVRDFIAKFLADNTSAISWLKYAGRSNKLPVRNLARLLTALLIHVSDLPLQVSAEHIPGILNIAADALSRFSKHPSWASLIEDESLNLRGVQAYRLPRQLLTMLWSVASSERIADTSETVTCRLLRLELETLPDGWEQWDSRTSLY